VLHGDREAERRGVSAMLGVGHKKIKQISASFFAVHRQIVFIAGSKLHFNLE
jgi:hypothetical protein